MATQLEEKEQGAQRGSNSCEPAVPCSHKTSILTPGTGDILLYRQKEFCKYDSVRDHEWGYYPGEHSGILSPERLKLK